MVSGVFFLFLVRRFHSASNSSLSVTVMFMSSATPRFEDLRTITITSTIFIIITSIIFIVIIIITIISIISSSSNFLIIFYILMIVNKQSLYIHDIIVIIIPRSKAMMEGIHFATLDQCVIIYEESASQT